MRLEGFCQLDNRPFYQTDTIPKGEVGQFHFHFDQLSFFRNNEYFSKITDGYTLFGNHLIPTLQYQVHPKLRLEGGFFLWQDFGGKGFQQISPIFTARFHHRSNQILMGSLDGGLAHQLIEPLYNFENQFLRRLEYGFQWKHQSRFLEMDTWIDWRNMIREYSQSQEVVEGGLRVEIPFYNGVNSRISFLGQATAFHKGGQIDTTRLPLITWFNIATGLRYQIFFEGASFFKSIDLQVFGLNFLDHSPNRQQIFTKGNAFYANASVCTKWFNFMASYWNGHRFTSHQGGKLYRGISSNISHPDYFESNREIIILRVLRDFKLAPNLYISARLEPYFDLRNQLWEFSHGIFFTYRGNLFSHQFQTQ